MAPPQTAVVPSSNIMRDDGHTIVQRLIVRGDFDDFQKQVEFLNKMEQAHADNTEAMARAAGTLAGQLDTLIQASSQDLDLQKRLLEQRQAIVQIQQSPQGQTVQQAQANAAALTGLSVTAGAIIPAEIPNMQLPQVGQSPQFQQLQQALQNPPTGVDPGALQNLQMGSQQIGQGATMPGWEKLLGAYEVLAAETGDVAKNHKTLLDKLTGLLQTLTGQAEDQIRKTGETARGGEEGDSTSLTPFRRLGQTARQTAGDIQGGQASKGEALVRRILQHVPGGAEGTLGKMVTDALPMAEKALPVIGAATTGFEVLKGAVDRQRELLRTTGTTTLRESAGYDVRARVMALSPFVSDAQSREIIQGALQQGFRGQTADNAIDFAVDNFKKFNMTVGDSMKLFTAGTVDAGASVQSLTSSLGQLQQTARGSQESWANLTRAQTANVTQLAGMGAGAAAVPTGTALAGVTVEDKVLAQHGYNLGGALQNQGFQTLLAQRLGVTWDRLSPTLAALGKTSTGTTQLTESIIQTAQGALLRFGAGYGLRKGMTKAQIENLGSMLPQIVAGAGLGQMSWEEAVHLVEQLLGTTDPIDAMNKRLRQNNRAKHEGFFSSIAHGASGLFHGVVGQTQALFTGNFGDDLANTQSQIATIQTAEHSTGQNMPLVEQWFQDLNTGQGPGFGSTAVRYQGKTYMLKDFENKFGAKGLLALQQGQAQVAGAGHGIKGKMGQFENVSQWVDPNVAAAMGQQGNWDAKGHKVDVQISFAPGADKLIKVSQLGVRATSAAEGSSYGYSNTYDATTTPPTR